MALTEYMRIQLQQSIETYRVQISLLVQICTVLTIADATVVGYAVSQKLAGVIWVGVIFPVSMILATRLILRSTIPVLAIAVGIELKHGDPKVGGLISTFLSTTVSPSLMAHIKNAVVVEEEDVRNRMISKARRESYSFAGGKVMRRIVYIVVILQIITPILLWRWGHWNCF
jgi:hypothetical protein